MKVLRHDTQLILQEKNRIVFFDLKDILFVEKLGTQSIIHTTDREISIQLPLKLIHEYLPEEFVRSHRSYIINKNKILEINLGSPSCYEVVYGVKKTALLKKIKFNEIFSKGR
ncbi:LytTR family transcriptional regulator DNA-binding domain-containing protein [Metabacillus sp. SLBN-84]